MIGISVLGSTGSIGVSTLDVIARHADRYRVVALTANRDVDRLAEQCIAFNPEYAVIADEQFQSQLQQQVEQAGLTTRVMSGAEALSTVAALDQVDYVMAAIVGAAGLLPTLAAANSGKRILLANKESLVMSGQLLVDAVRENSAELLPIDSEHNAIFQCLPAGSDKKLEDAGIEKILLTASGGPFLNASADDLSKVTPEQACAHPNWDMGRKISVDSATMMNKGLEVIEACWLFDITPKQIQVVIHPQSIIHSMVQYVDGSVLAQLGNPDMRTPIAHALAWPQRIASGVGALDMFKVAQLNFEAPDFERFPCLRLAYEAIETGGTQPAILNAANEVAVQAFLDSLISFDQIPVIIEKTMQALSVTEADAIETLLDADRQARDYATALVNPVEDRSVS